MIAATPPQQTHSPTGARAAHQPPSCPWAKVWNPPGKLNQHKKRTWEVVHKKNPGPWKAELLPDLPSQWYLRTGVPGGAPSSPGTNKTSPMTILLSRQSFFPLSLLYDFHLQAIFAGHRQLIWDLEPTSKN
jgi:hypothetical protein